MVLLSLDYEPSREGGKCFWFYLSSQFYMSSLQLLEALEPSWKRELGISHPGTVDCSSVWRYHHHDPEETA